MLEKLLGKQAALVIVGSQGRISLNNEIEHSIDTMQQFPFYFIDLLNNASL